MKYCKDCKHFKRFWLNSMLSDCVRPNFKLTPEDEVKQSIFGKPVEISRTCSMERTKDLWIDSCGPEAKYFEPKPKSWWYRNVTT